MKLIALDLGNTNLKLGVFEVGRLVRFERLETEPQSPEKTVYRFRQYLSNDLPRELRPNGLIYSSVVPQLEQAVVLAITDLFDMDAAKVVAAVPGEVHSPVDLGSYPPEQLGPDRLVNVCAAHYLYPSQPVLVIDFGTATTFDVVDGAGRFRGGVIAPGMQTFWKILPEKTGRLPEVSFQRPSAILGEGTVHCMQAGLGYGYVGLYREIVGQIEREFTDGPLKILMTGGLAKPFLEVAGVNAFRVDDVDPWLTLKGLYHLYRHHMGGGL